MRRLFNNKRGNFPDIIEYMHVALVIAVFLIISFMIYNNFDAQVQSNALIENVTKQGSTDFKSAFFGGSDYILPFFYVGFLIFSAVASRLIPSSSKLIIVPLLSLVLIPLIAMFFGNIWDGFATSPNIASVLTNNFTWTAFLLDNIVIFSLIYTFIVGVSLITKEDKTI